jgi:hypothetical protein
LTFLPQAGARGINMKCVSLPYSPLEAALSVFNVSLFFFVKNFFLEGITVITTKDAVMNAESQDSKNASS